MELLELYLQRIKRYNPTLNAVVVLNEQEAWQSAVRADEMRARGERGALLGLPLTIKVFAFSSLSSMSRWNWKEQESSSPRREPIFGSALSSKI